MLKTRIKANFFNKKYLLYFIYSSFLNKKKFLIFNKNYYLYKFFLNKYIYLYKGNSFRKILILSIFLGLNLSFFSLSKKPFYFPQNKKKSGKR